VSRPLTMPADVIASYLISSGFGVVPSQGPTDVWPITVGSMPTDENKNPDNYITVKNTMGVIHGRDMESGETFQHEGILIWLRSKVEQVGYAKVRDIQDFFDRTHRVVVSVGSPAVNFRIESITRTGPVMPAGQEAGNRRRYFHSANFVTSITQLEE
jgi:hypothetical protein